MKQKQLPVTMAGVAVGLSLACGGTTSHENSHFDGKRRFGSGDRMRPYDGLGGESPKTSGGGSSVGDGDAPAQGGASGSGGNFDSSGGTPTGGGSGAAPPSSPCKPGSLSLRLRDAAVSSLLSQADKNLGDSTGLHATKWTNGGVPHTYRSLLLVELPDLDSGTVLQSVELSLFATIHRDTFTRGGGHSNLTASNAAHFLPATESWDDSTVTWLTQPSTTTEGSIPLTESTAIGQNYTLDLTNWATTVYSGDVRNFGFALQLDDEVHYASLYFNSTDVHVDEGRKPEAILTYSCR